MVAVLVELTDWAVTVKFAKVCPPVTVTLPGTVTTLVSLLVSLTVVPPDGAFALRVTVPFTVFPLVTVYELRVTEDTLRVVDPDPQPGKEKDEIRVLQALPLAG